MAGGALSSAQWHEYLHGHITELDESLVGHGVAGGGCCACGQPLPCGAAAELAADMRRCRDQLGQTDCRSQTGPETLIGPETEALALLGPVTN